MMYCVFSSEESGESDSDASSSRRKKKAGKEKDKQRKVKKEKSREEKGVTFIHFNVRTYMYYTYIRVRDVHE